MKLTKIFCDRCKREISGVVYTVTCYAELLPGENPAKHIEIAAAQNMKQSESHRERHLCQECKDAVTDGIFIV